MTLQGMRSAFATLGIAKKRRIRVTEKVPLGQKGFLALIQVDDLELLVGSTGETLAVLAKQEIPSPDDATKPTGNFSFAEAAL